MRKSGEQNSPSKLNHRKNHHHLRPSPPAELVRGWDPEGRSVAFLAALPASGNVLLTSHDNPDPDALASCLALQILIKYKTSLTSHIAIGGILGRAENRALTLELDIDLYPIELLEHQPWDAVVTVDAQPGAGNTNLPRNLPITAIIDHHPLRHKLQAPFVDVRPEYGASGTILVEYLAAQGIPWDRKLATALFYAIKSETQDLGSSLCQADRRAYFALFDSVDWNLLHRILRAKIPGDYFSLFQQGIAAARLYGSAVVTDLGQIPAPDAVAELADFLLRHEQVSKAMVLGRYEDQIVFSLRFTKRRSDAGLVAAKIAQDYGTGGGHDMMAGGRLLLPRSRLSHLDEIKVLIVQRFLELVRAASYQPGEPLVPIPSLAGSDKP